MLRKAVRKARKGAAKLEGKVTSLAERAQIGKKTVMSVSDLFFMQFDRQELRRYDVVVRYLAIEQYQGENDYGFRLYRKMQDARVGQGRGAGAEAQFRALIGSYLSRGYDSGSCIVVDSGLALIDGSHRLALHLYLGLEDVRVLILPGRKPADYTIDWFFQNGFTDEEIDLILEKGRELTERANTGLACVIWSPAAALSEPILKDLAYFGRVSDVTRYGYRPEEYRNVVRAIYAADDIADWKIQKKLEHMPQQAPELISARLRFDWPDFRLKDATGMPITRRGERVKKLLRGRFREQVPDYFYDIILHIADNHRQSGYMFRVLEPGIDMHAVLEALAPYPYALAKTDSPYYPADFPRHIPVGKDVDILCLAGDCPAVTAALRAAAERCGGYEMRVINEPHGTRIRLEKLGHLILQLDISCRLELLAEGFVEEALAHRERRGEYMRLSGAYEYVYRAVSYRQNRGKTQHREYLAAHREELDRDLLERYAGMTAAELDALIGQ